MSKVIKVSFEQKDPSKFSKEDILELCKDTIESIEKGEEIVSFACFVSTDKSIYNRYNCNRYLEFLGMLECLKQDALADNIFKAFED